MKMLQVVLLHLTILYNGIIVRANEQIPSSGLYFMLGTTIYLPGDSVFITDIGDQPSDRSDPGLTLVCVTTNVNTACCRRRDNYYYYDRPLGEWYFPNGTTVPSGAYSDLYRVRFIYQMRLAKANSSTGPLGAYRCEVPDGETGENVSATINLTTQIATGFITVSPTMANFYTGLKLNFTCVIVLNSIMAVTVVTTWTTSSSLLLNSSQRIITEVHNVSSMIYSTSLLFTSLDKTRDEGNYTCIANVNTSYEVQELVLSQSVAISKHGEISFEALSWTQKSIFFQLKLSGISTCQDWKVSDASSKNTDIVSAIVQFMLTDCDCHFTPDRLTNGAFLCDLSSPQSVIYQAQLHGTRQATTAQLTNHLQKWAVPGTSVIVDFSVLKITKLCILQSPSLHASCEEEILFPEQGTSIVIGASLASLITIFLLATIALIVCLMFKKRHIKCNTKDESKVSNAQHDVPANAVPEYEEVDKKALRSFITDDISSNSCPAYDSNVRESPLHGDKNVNYISEKNDNEKDYYN